jgi:hypothetical protein
VRRAAYLLAVAGALGALANMLGGGDDDDGDTVLLEDQGLHPGQEPHCHVAEGLRP